MSPSPTWLAVSVLCAAEVAVAAPLDREQMERHVAELANEIGPRPRNSPEAEQAADYIEAAAEAAGMSVARRPVGRVVSPRVQVGDRLIMARQTHHVADDNLLVRIRGETHAPALLLMAHYDTVPGSPGAVDNAASVALLLELGRALRRDAPARPVILAWTASEERGLAGARALAADVAGEVGLAISLDMVGAKPDVSLNGLGSLLGEEWLAWLAARAREAGVDANAPIPHRIVSRRLPALERSDHGAFSERDVPAFHLYSRGPERIFLHYHTPGDTPDRVVWSAVDDTAALLLAIAHEPGALPEAGGPPGIWLSVPGGPVVLPTWLLLGIEVLLFAAAVVGWVAIWRRRQRSERRVAVGLIGFAILYAVAWLGAFALLALSRQTVEHPAPWLHAPLRHYAAVVVCAGTLGLAAAWLATWKLPATGAGRFLAPAIILPAGAGVGLTLVGMAELALPLFWVGACLGAMAWCRRWPAALAWLAVSMLPLGYLLDPGLLREGVFHGFFPADAPIAAVLALLLMPHALAIVYLVRRFTSGLPREGHGAAAILVACTLGLSLALASVTLPEPACSGDQFETMGLYCERYSDDSLR